MILHRRTKVIQALVRCGLWLSDQSRICHQSVLRLHDVERVVSSGIFHNGIEHLGVSMVDLRSKDSVLARKI